MIELEVVGLRLAAPEDSPILLLRETEGSRLLPIWISPMDAAAIAIVLDRQAPFHRPMTQDLLATVLQSLTDEDGEGAVFITEVENGVFHAVIEVGESSFDARPSDAVAVALRLEWPVSCREQLMDEVGVEVDETSIDEVERFKEFLESVNPDDFEPDH